jgi:hypothetical protein
MLVPVGQSARGAKSAKAEYVSIVNVDTGRRNHGVLSHLIDAKAPIILWTAYWFVRLC